MEPLTLLLITPTPPLPDSGGGISIFGTLSELKRRGAVIDLVCFRADRSSEKLEPLRHLCRRLVLIEGLGNWSAELMIKALLWQRPMVVVRHHSRVMQQAINHQLGTYTYKLVLVEFSFMFQYLMQPELTFAQGQKPQLVLEHRVVTPKVYQYFSEVAPNPIVKWFRRYEIQRLKAYLRAVLSTADQHLFVGQEDLAYIRQEFPEISSDKLIYRPTGLILERYPQADPAQTEPNTIGFFGAFNWTANVDAVHYFVRDILPLIQLRLPQVKFLLAGRSAPPSIRALASHPAIEFMGEVDDMFSLARRVAVMVVPLRVGAGTRLKILEALAWGKPVVSTSIGAEGIEFTPGEELLVADQPDLFAQTVIELLADPLKQRHLAQAGRRRVETMYTAQRSVDRLLAELGIEMATPEFSGITGRGD
ncbi:MAG: glycosyltransferase family 4 protein [Anaerolineae bacterium]|nr:glycosyltransferase family 4 protein [Anaerolineae bacterium]